MPLLFKKVYPNMNDIQNETPIEENTVGNFDQFDLPDDLRESLARIEFTAPTPIQVKAIPSALEGKDILGTAGTGTGKTGAFGIPMIAKLITNPNSKALIITPTRELATQVLVALRKMVHPKAFRSALLIGGEPIVKQLRHIKEKPRLIVGTPGRINDHLKRNKSLLNGTDYLVLDETDRMLDMGFSIQIEEILKFMTQRPQTLLFSATLPPFIEKMAQQYLHKPERIHVKSEKPTHDTSRIKHDVIELRASEKQERLLEELESRAGSVIIFVKTKGETEKMAYMLSKNGHSAEAINGDLRQNKRDRIIKHFRSEKFRVLVGTDIIARGLDIPHVRHVINYDLPQCPEDYIHRIGRTARAGATGEAICFVTPSDYRSWNMINRILNPDAKRTALKKPTSEQGKKRSFGKKRFGGDRSDRSNAPKNRNGNRFGGERSGRNMDEGRGRSFGNKPQKRTFSAGSRSA